MKAFRVHAYFEACASFDVEADTREEVEAGERSRSVANEVSQLDRLVGRP